MYSFAAKIVTIDQKEETVVISFLREKDKTHTAKFDASKQKLAQGDVVSIISRGINEGLEVCGNKITGYEEA